MKHNYLDIVYILLILIIISLSILCILRIKEKFPGTISEISPGKWNFFPTNNWYGDVKINYDLTDGVSVIPNYAILRINRLPNFVRYVRIGFLDSTTNYINLAEVEIYSNTTNIATNSTVYASSIYGTSGYEPNKLINQIKTDIAITTANGTNEYFLIDLGSDKEITKIVIYNRTDGSKDRINNLQVSLYRDNPYPNGTNRSVPPGATMTSAKLGSAGSSLSVYTITYPGQVISATN